MDNKTNFNLATDFYWETNVDRHLNFNPIIIYSTFNYTSKFRIPFDHPSIILLTGNVTSYKDILEASSENYKVVIRDISLFFKPNLHAIKTPEYSMHDREALMSLWGTQSINIRIGDEFW